MFNADDTISSSSSSSSRSRSEREKGRERVLDTVTKTLGLKGPLKVEFLITDLSV